MLKVQQFLEENSFLELQIQHGVYASFSKCGRFFSLNYSMIESKDSDELAQECRGLILGSDQGKSFNDQVKEINGCLNFDHIVPGKTKIFSFGFKRFFNEGQESATLINWLDPKLSISNKLDGSIIFIWFNDLDNCWETATRSRPQADQLLTNQKYTFRQLFEKAVKETLGVDFLVFTSWLNPKMTYMFELTSDLNQVVCRYSNCRITLLGMRNLETLKEVDIFQTKLHDNVLIDSNLKSIRVERYSLASLKDVVDYVSSRSPSDYEGVVVCDSNFNRIKIKSPAYVSLHHLVSHVGSSPRNCMEIVLQGKSDDVIPFLPKEIANDLLSLKDKVSKLLQNHDAHYNEILLKLSIISNFTKKDFALEVQKINNVWQDYFFKRFDAKCQSMANYLELSKGSDGSYRTGFLDGMIELTKNY